MNTPKNNAENNIITGLITKSIAGSYFVEAGDAVFICKARGVFKNRNTIPMAGDFVELDCEKNLITAILPRKNELVRPYVANVDNLVIVSSFEKPAPSTVFIDKLCVIAISKKIRPIVVFNKCDLGDFSQYIDIYKKAGIDVVEISAKNDFNCDKLLEYFDSQITVLCGNSGVGKSSIINRLFGDLSLKTAEISQKLGHGKHTTRITELFKHDKGYIVDTPGFSSLLINENIKIKPEELADYFPEFEEYLGTCAFTDCAHTAEKGCAIIKAVQEGKIATSRYESYKQIYADVKSADRW